MLPNEAEFEIQDDNLVTLRTPDGKVSRKQYPTNWTREQILTDVVSIIDILGLKIKSDA